MQKDTNAQYINHVNISDIHSVPYGDPYEFYTEELTGILEYIMDNSVDLITVAGDLFDTIYQADSNEVQITMKFIHQLLEIARTKGVKTRIVKGTQRHDYDQLKLFNNYCDNDRYDFRTINQIETEEVFEDFYIRYIPELYFEDIDDFEEQAFQSRVDIIIFHGLVEDVMPIAEDSSNSVLINKEKLRNTVNYYAVGGHIHNRFFAENNIWYTNSFSTKSFDDTDEKGFDHITIDRYDKKFQIDYIVNENCHQFEIYNLTEEFMTLDRGSLKARVLELKRNSGYKTHIRIDVDTGVLSQQQKDNLDFIRVKFRDAFKFKTFHDDMGTKDEVIEKKLETANYILDPTIPIENKIINELEREHNLEKYELTKEEVNKKKIMELIGKIETE